MGQSNLEKIQSSIVDLQSRKQITPDQSRQFFGDYISSGEKIKDINRFIDNPSLDLFLKHFINTIYPNQSPIEQFGSFNTARTRKSFYTEAEDVSKAYKNKIKHKYRVTLNDIKEINLNVIFTEMILQEKFRNLLISLFDLDAFHFVTVNRNKKTIKAMNSKILYFYDLEMNSNKFMNLFQGPKTPISLQDLIQFNSLMIAQIIGKKIQVDPYKYILTQFDKNGDQKVIMIFELDDYKWKGDGLELYHKNPTVFIELTKIISEGIDNIYIEIGHKKQQILSKKKGSKCLLDLLQFAILLEGIRFDKEIENIRQQKLIKNTRKFDQETYEFKVAKNQLLTKVRNYKKQFCRQKIGYLDFDRYGSLIFFYTDCPQNETMKYFITFLNEKQQKILKVFQKQNKILKYIKCASNGIFKSKQIELDQSMQLRFTQDTRGRLSSISVIIFLEADEYLRKTSKNKKPLLIQKINIMHNKTGKQGWMKNFLNIQSIEPSRNNSLIPGKLIIKKKTEDIKIQNFTASFSLQQLNQQIQLEDENINLLEFDTKRLLIFTIKVMSKMPYFQQLSHEKDQFPSFLNELYEEYQKNNNQFHNFTHGVNVMHTAFLLCLSQKNKQYLTEFQKFVTVFSALCHDVGHTGYTNSFEIARESEIAKQFNYRSPLQNYHASKTFEILRRPKNNFLSNLSSQEFKKLRKIMISNILLTDIKEHFGLMKRFQDENKALSSTLSSRDSNKNRDCCLLTGMIVHASDFAGSVKNFDLCRVWSQRVNVEFEKQYQEQKNLGILQTVFMKDLHNIAVLAKNQAGFLKVIVQPLYKSLAAFYNTDSRIKLMHRNSQKNAIKWQQIASKSLNRDTKYENTQKILTKIKQKNGLNINLKKQLNPKMI